MSNMNFRKRKTSRSKVKPKGEDCADDDSTKSSSPNNLGWSDNELKEMSKTYKFMMDKWNSKIAKTILLRFFNFYFTGKVPPEDNVIATVYDCVSLADVDGRPLFGCKSTGKIFYEGNVSSPVYVTSEINSISEGPAVARKLSAFHSYIEKAIAEFNTKSSTDYSDRKLQGLAGFLALTLCRFATKNLKQMTITLNDAQYQSVVESTLKWPKDKPFAPPVKEVLNVCSTKLTKLSPENRTLFCLLANEMVKSYAPVQPRPQNRIYLDAAVLADTAYNGLGMIKMLEDVCKLLATSWKDIRPMLLNDHSDKSCRRIDDFFINYLNKDEHGFPWARIIDDGYLRGYSPKENEFVCIAFTAIIEYDKGPAVWQAPWIKSNVSFYCAAKQKGKTIYVNKKGDCREKLDKCRRVAGMCEPIRPVCNNLLVADKEKPLDDRKSDRDEDDDDSDDKLLKFYKGPAAEVMPIPDFMKKATQLSNENRSKDWTNFWLSYEKMLYDWFKDGYDDIVRHVFRTLKHGLIVAVECIKIGELSIKSVKASQYDTMMIELKKITNNLQDMNETLKEESKTRDSKNLEIIKQGNAVMAALATLERSVRKIILQE